MPPRKELKFQAKLENTYSLWTLAPPLGFHHTEYQASHSEDKIYTYICSTALQPLLRSLNNFPGKN